MFRIGAARRTANAEQCRVFVKSFRKLFRTRSPVRGSVMMLNAARVRISSNPVLDNFRAADNSPEISCFAFSRSFGDENLTLLDQNQLSVEPQFALTVRFIDDPLALTRRAFVEGKVALMEQVANRLLSGSCRE
jgi:hypothetical protein